MRSGAEVRTKEEYRDTMYPMSENHGGVEERGACTWPGCSEPRKSYPRSKASTRCAAHESARVQAFKARAVVDPATGETVTAGVLANRQHRRRAAAKAGVAS